MNIKSWMAGIGCTCLLSCSSDTPIAIRSQIENGMVVQLYQIEEKETKQHKILDLGIKLIPKASSEKLKRFLQTDAQQHHYLITHRRDTVYPVLSHLEQDGNDLDYTLISRFRYDKNQSLEALGWNAEGIIKTKINLDK